MLKELFDAVVKLGNEAKGEDTIKVPDGRYLLRCPDGSLDEVFTVPLRNHAAHDLDTIAAWAKKGNGEVWYSRSAVVCIMDAENITERATMSLTMSDQVKALQAIESTRPHYSQRDLIFLLRTTFKACLAPAPSLIDVLRQLKFRAGSEASSTIQHGKRDVGRTIEAQVTGAGSIPEYFQLEVPIWANSGLQHIVRRVELALEPHPDTEKLQLAVMPGAIEAAIGSAETDLRSDLESLLEADEGDDVSLYHGNP